MADPVALAALWLATWWLHSTLLYGCAWLSDRLRLLRAPAAREHLWRAAMLGALLTATLQSAGLVQRVSPQRLFAARASTPAPAPPEGPRASTAPAAQAHAGADGDPSKAMQAAAPSFGSATLQSLRARLEAHGSRALLALWLAGSGLAALRLFFLMRHARRELVARVPAEGALAAEFTALCSALRVRRPVLSVAPALAGPIALPGGEIVVPPWTVAALDRRQRRALLAHELAHHVRHDPEWLVFALGLQSLFWLQPLHALARRRLGALAELQADAWAARAVGDPRALAECLAECAERLGAESVTPLGTAMAHDASLLVERVDRLLEGSALRAPARSWKLRGGVCVALLAAAHVLPGCDGHPLGSGTSITLALSDDGEARVSASRPGYRLRLEADGPATFLPDESDLATLAPGCTFALREVFEGVEHEYTVTSDGGGRLTRRLRRDGADVAFDAAGRRWLAAALPRMFRESGFDAQARVARLLASGGVTRVLAEVGLTASDHAKAATLGVLFDTAELDGEEFAAALVAARRIRSSAELRSVLSRALAVRSLDAPGQAVLLETAGGIDSDSERAELLIAASVRLSAPARPAWLAAAGGIDSDSELRRALVAALARGDADAAFVSELLGLAGARIASSLELGEVLDAALLHAADPLVAAAYLSAARCVDSNHERERVLAALPVPPER